MIAASGGPVFVCSALPTTGFRVVGHTGRPHGMPPLVAKVITVYISHMGVLLILTWTTENYTLTQCFRCGFNIFVYTEKMYMYVIAQSNRLYSYICYIN